MSTRSNVVLLTHNYYPEPIKEDNYQSLIEKPGCLNFINLCNPYSLKEIPANNFIISAPNQGKDIGGKLALLDLCLKLDIESEFYILLHDKKSPHTTLGEKWREKLFRIIEPQNIEKIKNMFAEDNQLGIVAAKEFIINEYDKDRDVFKCTSNSILKELIIKYGLNISNFDFVGGTMFWIRSEIFNDFFRRFKPLEIRATLEKGNVLDHLHGTQTHSWERMLSWIATDQGYKIRGI